MRKPRQDYTDEESTDLDVAAQQAFEQVADGGVYLPWGLCREMVELKFWHEQVRKLQAEVKALKGI